MALCGDGMVGGQKLEQRFKSFVGFKLTKNINKNLPHHPHIPWIKEQVSQSRASLDTSHTLHSRGCAKVGENVRNCQVGVKAKQMFAFFCPITIHYGPKEWSATLSSV